MSLEALTRATLQKHPPFVRVNDELFQRESTKPAPRWLAFLRFLSQAARWNDSPSHLTLLLRDCLSGIQTVANFRCASGCAADGFMPLTSTPVRQRLLILGFQERTSGSLRTFRQCRGTRNERHDLVLQRSLSPPPEIKMRLHDGGILENDGQNYWIIYMCLGWNARVGACGVSERNHKRMLGVFLPDRRTSGR